MGALYSKERDRAKRAGKAVKAVIEAREAILVVLLLWKLATDLKNNPAATYGKRAPEHEPNKFGKLSGKKWKTNKTGTA